MCPTSNTDRSTNRGSEEVKKENHDQPEHDDHSELKSNGKNLYPVTRRSFEEVGLGE